MVYKKCDFQGCQHCETKKGQSLVQKYWEIVSICTTRAMLILQRHTSQNAKVTPNDDLVIHLNSSRYSNLNFCSYLASFLAFCGVFHSDSSSTILFTLHYRMGMTYTREWIVISKQVLSQLAWRNMRQTKIRSFVTKSYTRKMGLKFMKLPQKSGELAVLFFNVFAFFPMFITPMQTNIEQLPTCEPSQLIQAASLTGCLGQQQKSAKYENSVNDDIQLEVITRMFSYWQLYQAWASTSSRADVDRGLDIGADMKTAVL